MHTLFLACLVGGFLLSILLVLLGGVHGIGHVAGHHIGGGHAGHHGVGQQAGHHVHDPGTSTQSGSGHSLVWALSWLSPLTLSGFALLFGAAGLLMEGTVLAIPIAVVVGLLGAILIRTLMRAFEQSSTAPLVLTGEGAVGTINSAIRPGGTGEVVYTLEGLHRSIAARAQVEVALPRGTSVVITHFSKGIAWVEPLDPLDRGD